MSVLLTHTKPERKRARFSRRGRRLSRPGLSLMAQGEPMIWLTGGALATCLAMIVGLILLVVWHGLPAFWPVRLVKFQLVDGKSVLGELTRTEGYTVRANELSMLSEAEQAAVKSLLAGRDRITVRRYYLRTGNFDITSEHFRWVPDFMVSTGGETYPSWAVTVERLEWGRFYGEPRRFTLRYLRPITQDERELQSLVQFIEANRWRAPSDQTESLNAATAPLVAQLQQVREARVADFLKSVTSDHGHPERLVGVLENGQTVALQDHSAFQNVVEVRDVLQGAEETWSAYQANHQAARDRFRERRKLEKVDIGEINHLVEQRRLAVRDEELAHEVSALTLANDMQNQLVVVDALKMTRDELPKTLAFARQKLAAADQKPLLDWIEKFGAAQQTDIDQQLMEPQRLLAELDKPMQLLPASTQDAVKRFLDVQRTAAQQISDIQKTIQQLSDENARYELTMVTAEGQEKSLQLADIVRAYPANRISLAQRLSIYADRWWEYLTDEPREANSEGGVLPAIWGTVVMTVVMSMLVVPFGVLAALYLREYAHSGWIVSVIRVSISNLAGVPSVVFGVFGLGFFCYLMGAYLDGGPVNAGLTPMAPKIWWLGVTITALVGVVAFAMGVVLLSFKSNRTGGWRRWLGYSCLVLWIATTVSAIAEIALSPYFGGFFAATLPNPTLGKGGLIWASLTLSLLTLPVVIVATEEALASVPNSLREGSFACGASKWQTIRRIVLPHAMPGVMTGMILAMARGAGEVAPLMLVGAVKLQPELPIDAHYPFIHLSRSFMHLGFHILDLGFQSQNIDANKPMVFTTTLLLIALIAVLNLAAIWIRIKLRRHFQGGHF